MPANLTPRHRLAAVLVALGAIASPATPPAIAQTTPPRVSTPAADAARIRELEETVQRLEAENAALRAQLGELQDRLDKLRPSANAAPDALPLDPYAAPPSLLADLKRRYARQLGDLPRSTAVQRDRFESQAQRWCERITSDIRGRTRWLAVVTDVRVPDRGPADAMVRVLDEFTQRPLGDALRVHIDRRSAERILTLAREFEHRTAGAPASETPTLAYEIAAMVIAEPSYNPERTDAGVFDVPPLVGVCVEFGMSLEIDSVHAIELPPSEPASPPARTAVPPSTTPPR